MHKLKVLPPSGNIRGTISLNGSKSIANRVQVIRALCGERFSIDNLSNADDTVVLEKLLASPEHVLDAGAGGTTYRFLTAYLATRNEEEHLLTGSARMLERPIGILVDALLRLGADIQYAGKEGYPPLLIKGKDLRGTEISIPANTSSQYISALLMIGPLLKGGLKLTLTGEIVSRPYIEMTLKMMAFFGIEYSFNGNVVLVHEGKYKPHRFFVEADWSAASYFYSIVALSESADITLEGISADSLQGDSVIADIMSVFGVTTTYGDNRVTISKEKGFSGYPAVFEYDFVACPDLAQTVVVVCAALKIPARLSGLQTLLIKETDRVAALNNELGKYGATFTRKEENLWELNVSRLNLSPAGKPEIATYDDHRMAMAFAPLALKTGEVTILEPDVVSKSYPKYWEDIRSLGFQFK